MRRPIGLDRQTLTESGGSTLDEAQGLSGPPRGHQRQPTAAHAFEKDVRERPVRIDDRRRIAREQRVEEPELRGRIGLGRPMIVEVIPAQVGEPARCEADAVEAALVDAVGGSLHGQALDPFSGQAVEGLVKGNRIRRRERPVSGARRGDETERSQARRRAAERREELPREIGDRTLSAGAGDRHHLLGLSPMEAGGRERERPSRVGGRG